MISLQALLPHDFFTRLPCVSTVSSEQRVSFSSLQNDAQPADFVLPLLLLSLAHPGFRGAGGGVRGVRPSCPMADYGFLRWRLVAAMAGIAHQPVLTMTSPQMITLTSLIDSAMS